MAFGATLQRNCRETDQPEGDYAIQFLNDHGTSPDEQEIVF